MTGNARSGGRTITGSGHAHHAYILRKIGPMPRRALTALQDYGLEDDEIARYLGLSCASLGRLRRTLGVRRSGQPPDEP